MGVADMKKIMEMIEPLLLPIHTRKLINSKATKVLLSGARYLYKTNTECNVLQYMNISLNTSTHKNEQYLQYSGATASLAEFW